MANGAPESGAGHKQLPALTETVDNLTSSASGVRAESGWKHAWRQSVDAAQRSCYRMNQVLRARYACTSCLLAEQASGALGFTVDKPLGRPPNSGPRLLSLALWWPPPRFSDRHNKSMMGGAHSRYLAGRALPAQPTPTSTCVIFFLRSAYWKPRQWHCPPRHLPLPDGYWVSTGPCS